MNYWSTILELHSIKHTNANIRFLQEYKFRKNTGIEINIKKKYQIGGTKYKFKDCNITIFSTEDTHSIMYSLKSESDCLLIDIDKEQKNIATITGISADYGCYDDNHQKMKGADLLDLAIYFIKTKRKFKTINNEILEIKIIQLTDNSHINCNNKKVKLSNLYTLTNGYTWYMNRGFVPIDIYDDKETTKLINKMINNYNIMNTITIENSNIYEYLNILEKTKENINAIQSILNYVKDNKTKLLKNLFNEIKKNFTDYCCIILDLCNGLYEEIGLMSFYKYVFISKI